MPFQSSYFIFVARFVTGFKLQTTFLATTSLALSLAWISLASSSLLHHLLAITIRSPALTTSGPNNPDHTCDEEMIGHDQNRGEPPRFSQLSEAQPTSDVEVKELNRWEGRMDVGWSTGDDDALPAVDLSLLAVVLNRKLRPLSHIHLLVSSHPLRYGLCENGRRDLLIPTSLSTFSTYIEWTSRNYFFRNSFYNNNKLIHKFCAYWTVSKPK